MLFLWNISNFSSTLRRRQFSLSKLNCMSILNGDEAHLWLGIIFKYGYLLSIQNSLNQKPKSYNYSAFYEYQGIQIKFFHKVWFAKIGFERYSLMIKYLLLRLYLWTRMKSSIISHLLVVLERVNVLSWSQLLLICTLSLINFKRLFSFLW